MKSVKRLNIEFGLHIVREPQQAARGRPTVCMFATIHGGQGHIMAIVSTLVSWQATSLISIAFL